MMNKKNVWIPIITFCVMIFGGMIWSFAAPDQSYSDTENRFLAQMPEFSLDKLFAGKFTKDYETYITDQFPARDAWIGLKTKAELLLGKVETKGVLLGKDDYLIVNHPATDFEGEQAEKNAAALSDSLAYYMQLLGEDHVRMMLVPTASQVLTDKLPAYAQPYDQSLYVDKVQKATAAKLEAAGVKDSAAVAAALCMDVEKILKEYQEEYIYYRTDHHWTTEGAFYVYQNWAQSVGLTPLADPDLKAVSEEFEGTTYSKLHMAGQQDILSVYDGAADVTMLHNQMTETEGFYDWSKLDTRDKYAMFLGGNDALLDVTRKGTDPETAESVLLVVKDSFANCYVPYAFEHFDRMVVVDLRFLNMSLKQVVEQYGVTDVLFLYNIQAAATDNSVYKISR